jgi:uncharacterized protein (TIGR03382 family)
MRRTLRLTLAAASLLAGPALASTNYPPILASESGAVRSPPCNVCHAGAAGGPSTPANMPFVDTLYRAGLGGPQNPNTLRQAVQSLRAGTQDTDSDGTRDFDELAASRDPNRAGTAGTANDCWSGQLQADKTCRSGNNPGTDGGTVIDDPGLPADPEDPRYGCSAAGAGGGLLAGLLVTLAGLTRRRRTR